MLDRAGIPVIVLKGALLAKRIYRDIGLRTMLDADLLFRKRDLGRAQKLLSKAQYVPYGKKIHIDYHWTLDAVLEKTGIGMDGLWQRAVPVSISGQPALALSSEDLILHLALHTAYHHLFQQGGLRSLCDIRAVVAHYRNRIDWDVVKLRAQRWNIEKAVWLTLYLAKSLLKADIPESFLSTMKMAAKHRDSCDRMGADSKFSVNRRHPIYPLIF
jgi:hypothetical protein